MKHKIFSKKASVAVSKAITVITAVVLGGAIMVGGAGVINHTVMPTTTTKVNSMFGMSGDVTGGGTGGGSIGDDITPVTELKRNGTIPEGGVYTVKATGAVLNAGDSFPDAPATGDIYEEGDYKYTYNRGNRCGTEWSVAIKDREKASYGEIISEISNKPMTNMCATFSGCASLVSAPKIPDNVNNLDSTFFNCYSLKTYEGSMDPDGDFSNYKIPDKVTNVDGLFACCFSLTVSPILPNNITSLNDTFNCTKISVAPTIPSSVKDMTQTFFHCSELKEAPKLPDNLSSLSSTFEGCSSLLKAPIIPNKVADMFTTFAYCTSLTTAPVIPSSVDTMDGTFFGCTSLAGSIEINANPDSYQDCFFQVKNITLTGSSSKLTEIAATGKNITIKK